MSKNIFLCIAIFCSGVLYAGAGASTGNNVETDAKYHAADDDLSFTKSPMQESETIERQDGDDKDDSDLLEIRKVTITNLLNSSSQERMAVQRSMSDLTDDADNNAFTSVLEEKDCLEEHQDSMLVHHSRLKKTEQETDKGKK